jgi:hypothetical protein
LGERQRRRLDARLASTTAEGRVLSHALHAQTRSGRRRQGAAAVADEIAAHLGLISNAGGQIGGSSLLGSETHVYDPDAEARDRECHRPPVRHGPAITDACDRCSCRPERRVREELAGVSVQRAVSAVLGLWRVVCLSSAASSTPIREAVKPCPAGRCASPDGPGLDSPALEGAGVRLVSHPTRPDERGKEEHHESLDRHRPSDQGPEVPGDR